MIKFTYRHDGTFVRDYEKATYTVFLQEDKVSSFCITKRDEDLNYVISINGDSDSSWEICRVSTYDQAEQIVIEISNRMYLNKLVDVDKIKEEILYGSKV